MEEQTVKKRGWVKNAAIIFLSVMLVLTFFSQTILNRSLPEVSASYVESGSINTKVRGSGTVTAGESYNVTLPQTRKVESVFVRVGDMVEAGDVLFLLSDLESDELMAAQDTLDAMELSYQQSLINLSDTDYARENREIQKAKADLAEAKDALARSLVTPEELLNAKLALQEGTKQLERLQKQKADHETLLSQLQEESASATTALKDKSAEYTGLEQQIAQLEQEIAQLQSNTSGAAQQLKAAKATLSEQQQKLANLRVTYGADYDALYQKAAAIAVSEDVETVRKQMYALLTSETNLFTPEENKNAMREAYEVLTPQYEKVERAQADVEEWQQLVQQQTSVEETVAEKQQSLRDAKNRLRTVDQELSAAQRLLNSVSVQLNSVEGQLDSDTRQCEAQKETVDALTAAYQDLDDKNQQYTTNQLAVETAQETLEDLIFELSEQKKADDKTAASESLNLKDQQKKIARQRDIVESLRVESVNREVLASTSGQISSIQASAGKEIMAGESLAVIEVVDRGYTLQFSVTNEQAQKVRVGDPAEISNYYWGAQVKASLTQIVNDPANPGKSKLLVFTLEGDVSAGENLTISIGEKSANFDAIVPASALRNDTNGTFVLVVLAKNTPLGNRYTATRVDVTVLAQDDTKAAVSGLSYGDFVITTSSRPIETGMQVKMVEDQ